jgi:hypothetical protein
MLPIGRCVGESNVSRCVCVNYLDLVVDPLNQELVQSRRNTMIGVNPFTAKDNTIDHDRR